MRVAWDIEEEMSFLGGQTGLREIASGAVCKCSDQHLLGCLRTIFKLRFGWPDKRGSQARIAEHLDIQEGALSRFRNGDDGVFLNMDRARLDDALWRLDIDPAEARPDREVVALSVMRSTLQAVQKARAALNDRGVPCELSDEALKIIADLALEVDLPSIDQALNEEDMAGYLSQLQATLLKRYRAYVLNGDRFMSPERLARAAIDWGQISDWLPYQFVLMFVLPAIVRSVALSSTQGDKSESLEEQRKRELQKTIDEGHARLFGLITFGVDRHQHRMRFPDLTSDEAAQLRRYYARNDWVLLAHELDNVEELCQDDSEDIREALAAWKAAVVGQPTPAMIREAQIESLLRKRQYIIDKYNPLSGDVLPLKRLRLLGKLLAPLGTRENILTLEETIEEYVKESGIQIPDDSVS